MTLRCSARAVGSIPILHALGLAFLDMKPVCSKLAKIIGVNKVAKSALIPGVTVEYLLDTGVKHKLSDIAKTDLGGLLLWLFSWKLSEVLGDSRLTSSIA
jgi:hypothetical protein